MLKKSKLSNYKIKKILKLFCEDLPASKVANLLGINRNTINRYFNLFRKVIMLFSVEEVSRLASDLEGKGIKQEVGRELVGKKPVIGFLNRNGKVLVNIVKNCSKEELISFIQGNTFEGSFVGSDEWMGYDGLILNAHTHDMIHYFKKELYRGRSSGNTVKAFWSNVKRRLAKFNGIAAHKFSLHLKESAFRFNYRDSNLYEKMLVVFNRFKNLI